MMTAKELKELKLETGRDRAVFRAYGMLRDRANYWELQYSNTDMANAYRSAATILEYAMKEDWAGLNQFNYYDEFSDYETRCANCAYLVEADDGSWVCDNCNTPINEILNGNCPCERGYF